MNLNNIVSGVISSVNPWMTIGIQSSTGYTVNPDGTQVPTYNNYTMPGQVQALQYNDLMQVSSLNIQGERRALYLNGSWDGVVRADGKGGDVITLPDGSKWLVVFLFEDWSLNDGWVKLCITRQVGVS
jgi:hypothetical protein